MNHSNKNTNPFFETANFVAPKLRVAMLSLALALPMGLICQSESSARVLQILAACAPKGQAQFVGNGRKGRSQLTSFGGPDALAGFYIEGIEGITIRSFAGLAVIFETPKDPETYKVTIRIKVAGSPSSKVQTFTVGANDDANLPNLPTTKENQDGTQQAVTINSSDLLGEKSKLAENDVIEKVSFIFHSTTKVKGAATKLYIDGVGYGGGSVPLLLEQVKCNLK